MIRRKDIRYKGGIYIENYSSEGMELQNFIDKYKPNSKESSIHIREGQINDTNASSNGIFILSFLRCFYTEIKSYDRIIELCMELVHSNDHSNDILAIGVLRSYKSRIRSKLVYKKRKRMINKLK